MIKASAGKIRAARVLQGLLCLALYLGGYFSGAHSPSRLEWISVLTLFALYSWRALSLSAAVEEDHIRVVNLFWTHKVAYADVAFVTNDGCATFAMGTSRAELGPRCVRIIGNANQGRAIDLTATAWAPVETQEAFVRNIRSRAGVKARR